MNFEEAAVNSVLRDIPMYHSLQHACLIEDKEIGVINESYRRSMDDKANDDEMEPDSQGAGEGTSTTPEPAAGEAGASAEGVGKSTAPDMHDATNSPSNPEEEFQISQDKGAVEAIDALFAMADDNNVCLKCGESGHPNYECPAKGGDQVKTALNALKKKLQGDDVKEKETSQEKDSEEQDRFRQENYKATREGEYMYLRAIMLSVIGDRAHGEKSINGVRADERGPATKSQLNNIVDTACQKGVVTTCKEMKSALTYSDHRMYKKLNIGTDIGKLKILPVNGGTFYSSGYAGHGVEYSLPTESNSNHVFLEGWEKSYSYYFNKALRHHIGRKEVWERVRGGRTIFNGLRCDEAGWVDIMEFLHHPWIFDHEKVRTEDDGLVGIDFREERVNTMIKTVWSEFQEKNKVRIQFLCIVLDSTFDQPDDYLKNVMKVGDDIHDIIAKRGEVFLAPIAVRSPGGFSAHGNDFRLDYGRICHPITTKIADDIHFCYHVTEFKNVTGIIKEGSLRPGGHRGGRTQVFLNPFVPWDKRYKDILGGQLTHLGQPRMVLAFSVHRLMSLGVMINASGQLVVNGNVPFSEVIAAWYQANNYDWERLLVDSGKFQLVRSCNEPKEIATANTVLRVARALLDEIDAEDNIPFYDQFVKDVEKLEKASGVLDPNSELRNDIVTFISENYTPREAGHLICPACLTETPNVLSICIRCHGSLVSWGEKAAKQDESTAPGMPERERQESGDGTEDEKEDVEMENEDQDEIDRLVRESKRTSGEGTDDGVDMSETKPSRTQTRSGGERERTAPDHNVAFGTNTKEQQEEEDERVAHEQEQDA